MSACPFPFPKFINLYSSAHTYCTQNGLEIRAFNAQATRPHMDKYLAVFSDENGAIELTEKGDCFGNVNIWEALPTHAHTHICAIRQQQVRAC